MNQIELGGTQRKINGHTINVFWAGGGYRIIVTRPAGSKVFDFAFDEDLAWEIAYGHAHAHRTLAPRLDVPPL